MKREDFLKAAGLSVAGVALAPLAINADDKNSTYNKLIDQVGFNHLPNKEIKSMKSVLHRATTRGHANHGWLDTNHTFSFANYYNPERMNFGVLRVLNDDTVSPGMGFGTHPHDNMEIISIPLEGDLEHQDSMNNKQVIKEGDIQVMSAGTGIYHSEYNRNKDKQVKFLQIWVFPNKKGVTPRYDQITLDKTKLNNQFHQILSPNADDDGVWIHQNAWFNMAELEAGKELTYRLKDAGNNGLYTFVLDGEVQVNNEELTKRDGYGVWETDSVSYKATSKAKILLMEVPMNLK